MSDKDEVATHVAVVLRTTNKFVLRYLSDPRSRGLKDAAIEEIAQRVSRGVHGMFNLTKKEWVGLMPAQSQRHVLPPSEDVDPEERN